MQLSDLEGRWGLLRHVEDHRARVTGTLEGEAAFTAADVGLIYRETGILRIGDGPPLRAQRCLIWRQDAMGAFVVCFSDGCPFHRFSAVQPEAAHLCGADLYRVQYDFGQWPCWRAIWRVNGPAKDYRLVSSYMP